MASHPLVTFSRTGYPEAHEGIAKILAPYTRSPNVVAEYDTSVSLIASVEAGRGIALLFETAGALAGGRLVLRPLDPEPPPLPIAVAYNPQKISSLALAFVAAVKDASPRAPKHRRPPLVVP